MGILITKSGVKKELEERFATLDNLNRKRNEDFSYLSKLDRSDEEYFSAKEETLEHLAFLDASYTELVEEIGLLVIEHRAELMEKA